VPKTTWKGEKTKMIVDEVLDKFKASLPYEWIPTRTVANIWHKPLCEARYITRILISRNLAERYYRKANGTTQTFWRRKQ
jgi:hypothetical protein